MNRSMMFLFFWINPKTLPLLFCFTYTTKKCCSTVNVDIYLYDFMGRCYQVGATTGNQSHFSATAPMCLEKSFNAVLKKLEISFNNYSTSVRT